MSAPGTGLPARGTGVAMSDLRTLLKVFFVNQRGAGLQESAEHT